MKKSVILTLLFLLVAMIPLQANDYLEQKSHYTVMNMGNGVYRFYIPIWVYGRWNKYYLDSYQARNSSYDSYIWYSLKPNQERGAADVHRIATVAAVRGGKNYDEDVDGTGEGFIYVHAGGIVMQNLTSGVKLSIPAGDDTYWEHWNTPLQLKRKNDDGHVDITYLEFDWYPPQELAGKDFYWGVSANIYKYSSSESTYTKWWAMEDRLNMSDPQTPELFTPYLYALDDEGVTGFGNAAVQFAAYQTPVSYHTSFDPKETPVNDYAGAIIVPTADSVQRDFYATFRVNLTNDSTKPQIFTLKTNTVHIPAYHRIYDFHAEEILDEQKSVTGSVRLSWNIHNPGAEDIVDGDVFQVERALHPDFSDAQTIAVESFRADSATYSTEDDPTTVLLEDTTSTGTLDMRVNEKGTFTAYDAAGDPKIIYEAVLTSNHIFEPGRPVYYRVRRGSSAVWGWKKGFSMVDTLTKNSYLAPLEPTQADYTMDPEYETNRKVHFQFHLENKPITLQPEIEALCDLKYTATQVNDLIPIRLRLHLNDGLNLGDYRFKLIYLPPEGSLQQAYMPIENNTFLAYVESGSMVQISVVNREGYSVYVLDLIGDLDDKAAFIADWELSPSTNQYKLYSQLIPDETAMQAAMDSLTALYPLPDTVRHTLYAKMSQKVAKMNASDTRCNWDRNALLFLQRIAVETGDTLEIPVPADSIKRQEDGSWIAHMTNVANLPCMHYRYAVRIDQTNAMLKVQNPSDLLPVAINGPDLYYNEVADIAHFDASQGTDRYGIILQWEQTPGGVDFYELSRREADSSADYQVVTKTEDNNYRDNDVVPGKEYEYRLMVSYTCNDTTTTNFATTTGSRSPYGLINGRIHYSDGTGCPGVKVRLESAGMSDLETVTDGAGRYAFDSLLYGERKEYSIIPTSSYAEFRFNNTSMTTASITLDATNPVAEGIEFDNISSVRLSGRILYELSTIPVRDANLMLDGVMIERAGGPLKTDVSGNFEIQVPKNHSFTLQAVKEGHVFEGDGFIRMNNDSNLVLEKALDGVRIWDKTKVRLAGRIVGGKAQALKPLGFGLSKNNLGDDLQLVLELEGDNISQIVRDPDDLTRDTLEFTVPHVVYDPESRTDTVGATHMHYQKKRIIINPDPKTGEYCADLFPVRYKITQATARGYATLFAEGKTSEVIDLSSTATRHEGEIQNGWYAHWNEKYNITYRSPIEISCIQVRYGLTQPFFGEERMFRQNVLNKQVEIPLAEKDSNGVYQYTFGHPVFATGKYSFRITAHEDYYYNNDKTSTQHEEVPINGGTMKVYNGLHASEETQTLSSLFPRWEQATQRFLSVSKQTDPSGQIDITIPVDYVSFNKTGEQALRGLDVSVESDGRYIEKQVLQGYVTGNRSKGRDFMTKIGGDITLLDVLRDPPGAKSYAFLEKGSSFNYSYSWNVKVEFGVNLNWKYGSGRTMVFGSFLGAAPGQPSMFSGLQISTSVNNTFTIPITSGFSWKGGSTYTFTTNERIETGNDNWFVGSRGDIYIGLSQGVLLQMADAVQPLDSLTYSTLSARLTENVGVTGSNTTVAEGRGLNGQKYYLAIGEEVGTIATVDGTFAYSQDYILTVLLPQLLEERNALLVTGDSATVQAIADAKGTEVYWSHVLPTDTTFALTGYEKVIPSGDSATIWFDVDRVAEYNKTIGNWLDLIATNEDEKINVMTGIDADMVGNYSVSNGVKISHSDTYSATSSYAWKWNGLGASGSANIEKFFISKGVEAASKRLTQAMKNLEWLYDYRGKDQDGTGSPFEFRTKLPNLDYTFDYTPILNVDWDMDPNNSETYTRSAGFVLEPDEYSYMNVDVLRRREPNNKYNEQTAGIRDGADNPETDYEDTQYLYGSYVYRLNGGATKCPWEGPEESIFYSVNGKPVQMSQGTLKLENPKLDILNHEVSDVPRDQPAIIHIRMSNETQQMFENYVVFKLVLVDASNPNGLKVLMDGYPLTGNGRSIKLNPGQTIDKTLEVYAGQGYDFENITLMLASECDILNFIKASFSVHYQPVSCDVNIATPHDKWVMNTLSPKDSTGWYMPVVIDGYDINYPNFDHIEFQYKLTKQSDDGWVNLCSFYADSTYFNEASGSKAMMNAGRIENIAFYGERDPMEQQYDLRAVSFCRYGTSYLTKSSPVLTGIKDTRPPRVFGEPEPANSILGVGDNLLLRFNEPIAGNYLDEDNNFQITGITNTTGLSASTALHFDGKAFATTKAKRDLTETDFTIDMMIRPTEPNNRANDMILFETGDGQMTKQLILTKDNYLRLIKSNGKNFLGKSSRKLEDLRAFTRVLCVHEKDGKTRFYLGTEDVTSNNLGSSENAEEMQDRSAYFQFGNAYDGDMLEARIWTKALTLEEISATANHSLTGYERELLAYYRMDEGKGETVTDHAHGATLYLTGCSWNKQKGYSLRLNGEPVQLAGNLLGRSAIYDETMLFWFKAETDGTLFNAARQEATDSTAARGTLIALENGNLVLHSGNQKFEITNQKCTDGAWHHFVLTVNRTYNNAAIFLDGKMVQSFDALNLEGITGAMWLGGNGFKGNIDEFVIFEQALPKSLVELYEENALAGDEMGLMAYLPFEEQYTNANGIIEQRFSVNDRRIFKDANGNVVNKVVPLVITNDQSPMTNFADQANNAPVKSHGVLNKLYFDWSFNNDELMINILNRDYELNKQSVYVTVRDVEDLNGNPMASPVSWTAFVDRNSLKWSEKTVTMTVDDQYNNTTIHQLSIINQSGKRHTYTIESLPSWLSVSTTYGAIDPMGEQTVCLTFNPQMAVGEYSDIIYLTDENGLSEPLRVEYNVEAVPPYEGPDEGKYPHNMSVCAQVLVGGTYDTDERDIVYAFYRNECVGMENVSFDDIANRSNVYLTVYGDDDMNRAKIRFQLWQAATGKLFDLSPDRDILFSSGAVYGCGNTETVILTANGWERQNITLRQGWNWTSFYLNLQPQTAKLSTILSANEPWTDGDIIKNPATRHFVSYSDSLDNFVGQFGYLRYIYSYMIHCQHGNTMYVYGDTLPQDSMHITVHGNGQWSAIPCLFDRTTSLTEALADYYGNASTGDLIKAQDRFAYFSDNGRWEGNLTALRPGEGYFFRRTAPGDVTIQFFKQTPAQAPRLQSPALQGRSGEAAFRNPNAATNMTMIAQVANDHSPLTNDHSPLMVYVNDELVGMAEPLDSLYFLTIQCDHSGDLRFEMNGETLIPTITNQKSNIKYHPDSHAGSLKAPILLRPADQTGVYKIIENDHVIIIRNNERYDVTGKRLQDQQH